MKKISLQSLKLFRLYLVAFVAILAIVFGLWSYLNSQNGDAEKMDSITIGAPLLEPSAPIFVAYDQHFFSRNGLNVTIKYYDTGLSAVNALQKGEVDISSTVAEYVLAGKAFKNERIQTIGSFDRVEYAFIVGRKDRGIKNISDLERKRIGVIRGTMLEFYLGRFLELHGISIKEVILVNITQNPQSVDAIVSGDVDAVVSVPPYVNAAQDKLGDNAVVWPAQSNQQLYHLLISRNEWITQHPKLIERFLNAISQAEEYMVQHPDEAKAIVKKRMNFTDDYIDAVWSRNDFSLSLDQSLILAMEDEARWMINNNLTSEKKIPDFLNYIYTDGLEKIKPESVNIIR